MCIVNRFNRVIPNLFSVQILKFIFSMKMGYFERVQYLYVKLFASASAYFLTYFASNTTNIASIKELFMSVTSIKSFLMAQEKSFFFFGFIFKVNSKWIFQSSLILCTLSMLTFIYFFLRERKNTENCLQR